ncbi:DUF1015 family protein [Nonomuraea guangzhouensis]|uniref:DUF1015 family protein n=1 Tax=Nonomuraea guangzhouensis TaxID=1291555 RepID=A0ABW4GJU3_9ACTN|nr:DUF1015 domain-containing protein [Nonomuraea guangzhouensis]
MGNPELPVPDGLLLRPFRGVRFTVDDPAKVTSPPYDLIADGDVRTLLDAHPNNVVRLILPCSAALKSPEEHPPHPSTTSSVPPDDTDPIAETDDRPSVSTPGSLAESTHQSAPDDAVGIRRPQDSTAGTHDAAEIAVGDHDNAASRIPVGHRPGRTPDNPAANQHSGLREEATQHSASAGEATEHPHDDERPSGERHAAAVGDTALQPCGDTPAPSADERYGVARDTLLAWLDAKVLVPDEQPALYVYEQQGPGVLQRGLIGDVALSDPARRIILPHEDIFPGPVADRLALMSTTQANLEPIFLLYDGGRGTTTRLVDHVAATRRPLVTARTENGLHHRLWAITDPAEIDAVNTDLRTRQALIADGHHRYATYRVLQRQEHAARAGQAPDSWPLLTTPSPAAPRPSEPSSPDPQPHLDTEPEPNPAPTHGTQPNATPPQGPPPQGLPPQGPGPTTAPTQHTASDAGPDQGPESATATSAHEAQPAGQRVHGSEQGQSAFGPWDFGLALLVDSSAYPPDLKAIHRVIPGLPLAEAAARAKGSWRVHDHADLGQGLAALEAAGEPAFLLAGEGGYHLLTNPDPVQLARAMPPDRSDRWNSLNISILSEFVLPKVWGMEDDQQAVRIVHHDPEAALRLALDTGGTAVILKPLAVDDVLAIAAGGERVPRKSTSFGPKPITGLVLRTFATG